MNTNENNYFLEIVIWNCGLKFVFWDFRVPIFFCIILIERKNIPCNAEKILRSAGVPLRMTWRWSGAFIPNTAGGDFCLSF